MGIIECHGAGKGALSTKEQYTKIFAALRNEGLIEDRSNPTFTRTQVPKDINVNEVPPHIEDAANSILRDEDPVKFIIDDNFLYFQWGNRNLGVILLLSSVMSAVSNAEPINPKPHGEMGKGKTWAIRVIAFLQPQEYMINASMSDKSLFYRTLKKSILEGSIIFSDDVNLSKDMEQLLKRVISNFQFGTEYETVQNQQPLTLSIPKRVQVWLNDISNTMSPDLLDRLAPVPIDQEKTTDDDVVDFVFEKAGKGMPPLVAD